MQNYFLFAAFDTRTSTFSAPLAMPHEVAAFRFLEEVCADPNHSWCKFAKDIRFFKLGFFNDDTGFFELCAQPELMAEALQFQRQPVLSSVEFNKETKAT